MCFAWGHAYTVPLIFTSSTPFCVCVRVWREEERVKLSHKNRICKPYQLFNCTLRPDRTDRPEATAARSLQIATASPLRGDSQTLSVVQCYTFCGTISTVLCLTVLIRGERKRESRQKRICKPYQLFNSTLRPDRTARPGTKVSHSLQIATTSPFRGDSQTLSVVQCYLFCETFSTVLCLTLHHPQDHPGEVKVRRPPRREHTLRHFPPPPAGPPRRGQSEPPPRQAD